MTQTVTAAELRRAFLAQAAGDVTAAEAGYRRCLDTPALADAARRHLIHLLEAAHRWDEALQEIFAAYRAAPDAPELKVHLANALLGVGRYGEAWPLLEARAQLKAGATRPELPYPEWNGGPVRSLTVWDELGAGDTVQFARFVPDLAARGIDVTLFVRPELASLMESLGVRVVAAQGRLQVPDADAWAMIGSLPGRLGVTLDSLPGRTGYLKATTERLNAWAPRLRPSARIGVAAKGKATHPNDRNRSLTPPAAAFLHALPGAENLLPGEGPLPLKDFADTAAVVQHMDLIITVDTALAHVAGALGKPCWVLLPWEGEDWRWLHDGRTTSPWYPSLKLYRQPAPGDWATPLRQIALDLPAAFSKG